MREANSQSMDTHSLEGAEEGHSPRDVGKDEERCDDGWEAGEVRQAPLHHGRHHNNVQEAAKKDMLGQAREVSDAGPLLTSRTLAIMTMPFRSPNPRPLAGGVRR